ncbi:MFS transporter [Nocardiopsis aegyptia]|uniref:MFS family permease n=1 Tax=Nocardiopsis aegyptia TaxID=220378 RepID=A0A7Z0EQ25_9ACTN|nr:MFS transporter [Nocardiopsis aegyptia]NYJ36206.1 MFS family permease [Nocardiopsis aegyptia]
MTTTAVPAPTRGTRPALALAVLALAHFAVSVDFNVVYIALPEIGRALGFSPNSLPWVVNAFALGFGGFLLLGGRAADRLGARRVLVLGAALMGAASVVGALALHPAVLVAARAAQGLGAAALFPATLALVNTVFAAGPERNRALAVWGTAGAFGALAGGAVGGILTSAFGWSAVFWVLVPLTLVTVLGAPRVLPADGRARGAGGFDALGGVLVTAGALLLVFGVFRAQDAGWLAPESTGAVALGAAVLGVLAVVERRTADPLLPPRLLTHRSLVVTTALILVLMGIVNTLHYVYTSHVQDVLGLSPLVAGLGFLPQGAAAMAGSMLLLPPLLNRWGVRAALFTGTLGVGATALAFAAGVASGSYWALLPAVVMLGITAGTTYPAVFAAAGAGVGPDEQGVSSAMVSTAQQIGGALGLAALVAVANAGGTGEGAATAGGLATASWVGGAVTIAAAFLALALRRPRTEESAPS